MIIQSVDKDGNPLKVDTSKIFTDALRDVKEYEESTEGFDLDSITYIRFIVSPKDITT